MILDDELINRKLIADTIERTFEDIKVIGEADSVEKGIKIISQNKVDILFLDIHLNENIEAGFNLLRKSSHYSFDTVIVAENDSNAAIAFDFEALDYLLKPIHPDRLRRAIYKLVTKKNTEDERSSFKNDFMKSEVLNKKIGLSDKYELNFIKLADIYYCKAEGFYTRFFLKNGKDIMVSKNIKEYEYLLPPKYFFRSHKSYLVNINEINKYIKSDGGYIIMENGDNIPISVRKREDFLKTVMKFSSQ